MTHRRPIAVVLALAFSAVSAQGLLCADGTHCLAPAASADGHDCCDRVPVLRAAEGCCDQPLAPVARLSPPAPAAASAPRDGVALPLREIPLAPAGDRLAPVPRSRGVTSRTVLLI